MPKAPSNTRDFEGLLKVVEHLRGPEGCPWDKAQTHQTLTRFAIEEAHELADAIDGGNLGALRDELGDLLLQVVLHAEIARQAGHFDVFDVIEGLNQKMIRRHPHVFADVNASTPEEVLKNWAEIKAEEKHGGQGPAVAGGGAGGDGVAQAATGADHKVGPTPASCPFDIPVGMPALLRAFKIGEKTRRVQFDFTDAAQCWEKVREEVCELDEALGEEALANIEAELGDVLFSLAQLARHLELDPEQALRKTNQRFERRYSQMQVLVTAAGLNWQELTPDQREAFWQKSKAQK